ncbi:MAG: AraC family ligand binding domain-containing protein [Clostridia bacterium]|nr:AraC family ligand binding domain-containing protein [Clostridia bacterium]MBQ3229182.1 AraC family ligand binding domain-containing protein [Clostridia bacterium]
MRQEISIPLTSGQRIKVRYAREDVSPETYYDHMHDHSLLEVCIFLSGKMLHFSGGHTYRLSRGDIFFARPGELHYALAAEDSLYERYAFWIPEDFFSFFSSGDSTALSVFSDERLGEGRVFRLSAGADEVLFERLERLRESLSGDESIVIFARLCEVISFINKSAEESDSVYGSGTGEIPSVIHDVVRYVRENYPTVTGVDEVADRFSSTATTSPEFLQSTRA